MFNASAEGASEKFRVFYRGTAYDVIIFKFQGGGIRPTPLLTPMVFTVQSFNGCLMVVCTHFKECDGNVMQQALGLMTELRRQCLKNN